jgi:hypothetical protein
MKENITRSQRVNGIRSALIDMVEKEYGRPRLFRSLTRRSLILGAVITCGSVGIAAASLTAVEKGWIALPGTNPSASPSYAPIPSWPVNANGQTYGKAGDSPVMPDLIEVQGEAPDGQIITGYVHSSDLEHAEWGGSQPTSPEQAVKQEQERRNKHPNGIPIPVYKNDGMTKVGTFWVGS